MRKFIVPMLLVLVAGVLTAFVQQNPEADRLMGVWEPSNGRARVKIEKIGAKYYGKFVWLKEPIEPTTGQPKTDKNNPDPRWIFAGILVCRHWVEPMFGSAWWLNKSGCISEILSPRTKRLD